MQRLRIAEAGILPWVVLSQTVPDGVKTSEVTDVELYLRTLLSQVDSSLADEWERMRDPNYQPLAAGLAAPRAPGAETMAPDVTRDAKAFTAFVADELRRWAPVVRGSGAKND